MGLRRESEGESASGVETAPDAAVFRALVDAGRCMLAILRRDRTVAYFNAFARELTGCATEDVLGADYFERFVPKNSRAKVQRHFARALAGEPSGEIEHPLLVRGNTVRWVVCSFQSLDNYEGGPAIVLTAQDITVHKRTEETLRHRTHDLGERVKELNCLFGLSRLDEDPTISFHGILQGLADILPPAWQYPEVTCARIVFEGHSFRTWNYRETEWRQAAPIVLHDVPAGSIEVCYLERQPDAVEGPFLVEERRLIDALAQRLGKIAERRQLEKEIVDISTREQQRIGQELHDGLGQELTGLGYLAEMLRGDLRRQSATAEADTADSVADGIGRALEQARAIAAGLVPAEIDAAGLVAALRQLADGVQQRWRIACRFTCNVPAAIEDTAKATQLFRIVQEAVNNAAKHARATQINIEVQVAGGQVVFHVRDNGVGMPQDIEPTRGMGLRIMQQRANVIGATLSIAPADGGGTLVTCTIADDQSCPALEK